MKKLTQKQQALLESLRVSQITGWIMRTDVFYRSAHDVETLNALFERGLVESECGGKLLRLTQSGRAALGHSEGDP